MPDRNPTTIYNVYDATLQVHRIIHNFTLLFFATISFLNPTEYLPNLLAMKPRQIDVPERLAQMTCRNDLPN